MDIISFRMLDPDAPGVFAQYLLEPSTQSGLDELEADTETIVIGAVWNDRACGALKMTFDRDLAVITSLYVDPLVRGRGIAGQMLDRALSICKERELLDMECHYILHGDELAAMDTLFTSRGGEIDTGAPVYGMDSRDYRDHPVFGPVLGSSFTKPDAVVLFSDLTDAQREMMDQIPGLPDFLKPSYLGSRVDPGLSAAWVEHGNITAFVLGFQSGETMFDISSVWRGKDAPEGCFRSLIFTQINQCWYRCGGDFTYFMSPIHPRATAILEQFTGGNYKQYEQHTAYLDIPEQEYEAGPEEM